jgi:hypothetical protein
MKKLRHNSKRNSVTLCCNSVKCPEVYPKDKQSIQIRDDDGFVITITREQALMIPDAIKIIDSKE